MKKFKKLARSRKFWAVLAITLVLGGFFFFRARGKKEAATITVERGTVKEELILTGQIKAEKYATLSFPTSGKISWVGVTEGQRVYKGQALTSLDKIVLNTVYQQALNSYRNYQAAAESTLDSLKDNNSDETFAQKATRTAAEVARDNAYDAVKAARYNLDNATLLAPFAGVITSLPFPNAGINVSFTDIQIEIVDPAALYFEVEADQSEVTNIKDGQEVIVVLDSYSDKEFKGKVSFVSYTPKAGEAGTVYKIKVVFEKRGFGDNLPRIGMTGDAKFILSQKDNVLFAPPRFINSDKEGKYINLGKIGNKIRVEIGVEGEDRVEITKGVKEGDTLYD